jgi:hypothetical protein
MRLHAHGGDGDDQMKTDSDEDGLGEHGEEAAKGVSLRAGLGDLIKPI